MFKRYGILVQQAHFGSRDDLRNRDEAEDTTGLVGCELEASPI